MCRRPWAAAAELRTRAVATTAAFSAVDNPRRSAQAMPLLLSAVDALSRPPCQIVVAGTLEAPDTQIMLHAIRAAYLPDVIVLLADGGPRQRDLAQRMPHLENVASQNGRATAYLCENGACQLPTNDPAELLAGLIPR